MKDNSLSDILFKAAELAISHPEAAFLPKENASLVNSEEFNQLLLEMSISVQGFCDSAEFYGADLVKKNYITTFLDMAFQLFFCKTLELVYAKRHKIPFELSVSIDDIQPVFYGSNLEPHMQARLLPIIPKLSLIVSLLIQQAHSSKKAKRSGVEIKDMAEILVLSGIFLAFCYYGELDY
ncbi:MAG: hypothetical protein V4543_02135 [Bacteroidota bacterium]